MFAAIEGVDKRVSLSARNEAWSLSPPFSNNVGLGARGLGGRGESLPRTFTAECVGDRDSQPSRDAAMTSPFCVVAMSLRPHLDGGGGGDKRSGVFNCGDG